MTKRIKDFRRKSSVRLRLPYPEGVSEMDIVLLLANGLRERGLDARVEVPADGANSINRMDIVIFSEDRDVMRIIEVKKHESNSSYRLNGKEHRRIKIGQIRRQCSRYSQFGPVDLVCGLEAAEEYLDARSYLDDVDSDCVRVFG